MTLADISVAAALQPLLATVISSAARSSYPSVMQWFSSLSGEQSFAKILGEYIAVEYEYEELLEGLNNH